MLIMTHCLKTLPEFFKPQTEGIKLFELRKYDRPFEIGDTFISQEFDDYTGKYTGKENHFIITYILKDVPAFGLFASHCILQLKPIATNYL